jgi:hypothetical protein
MVVPCTAIWHGIPVFRHGLKVFVDVDFRDVYESPEKLVPVFQDLGGEILMWEVPIGDLVDIKPFWP